jgi:hypothetical protein
MGFLNYYKQLSNPSTQAVPIEHFISEIGRAGISEEELGRMDHGDIERKMGVRAVPPVDLYQVLESDARAHIAETVGKWLEAKTTDGCYHIINGLLRR